MKKYDATIEGSLGHAERSSFPIKMESRLDEYDICTFLFQETNNVNSRWGIYFFGGVTVFENVACMSLT